jgi:ABC-type dipeptide/oligopeptide/nickel transport system permease subunit
MLEFSMTMRRLRSPKSFTLIAGGIILAVYVMLAVLGQLIAPYGIDDQDLMSSLTPPCSEHWFGTDALGRDMLSRVVVGAYYTLSAAMTSAALASVGGVIVGILSGYGRGPLATMLAALIDLLLTMPSLVLAVVITSVISSSVTGLVVATTVTFIPSIARLVRSRTLEIRQEDYVQAARGLGASSLRIMLRHVLPNAMTVILVETSLVAGQAVLVATALGFLGLGVPPPAPEWGTMLGEGREYIASAPHLVLYPALAISILILGFNLFGDGLRDRLDTRSE